MNAEQYLDYLIETSQQEYSFGIQTSELKTLKALLASENGLLRVYIDKSVNEKGNG